MRPRGATSSEAERPTLERTKSVPVLEKPEFEIEIDLERFTGKVVAGLSETMEEQQAQQTKQEPVINLPRWMDKAMRERPSRFNDSPLTEQEVELSSSELGSTARNARKTACAKVRDPCPALSVISISSDDFVRLPEGAVHTTLPGIGTQTDSLSPPPSAQNNNQVRQDRSWTPINAPNELRAMRLGLVCWDSTPYKKPWPYIGNGNLTLSEATQPSTACPTAEIPKLERILAAQQAQSERHRTRGADLASMAGATAFDHTGTLTVFTSFRPRQNQGKRARECTRHENIDISLPDKYRWDVSNSEVGDGEVEKRGQEQRVGKSEGYRTIYSYFQSAFRHRQGVPPERVRFEMRNGYLHLDGMQVPHLPGFEYGVGYADEETSQRMIRERERTSRHVARPVRARSASQSGQFALQVTVDARERLQNPRNRISGRFYCEEEGCGQSFNLEGHLRFHRRLRHGPVDTYRCEECPKSFRQENQLARHQRIHERQRREALVRAVLDNRGAQSQQTSEGALPGTARSSAETLRTFEALAGFDELPLRLHDTQDGQPQNSEQNGNAEDEHTGTTPTGADPPGSDGGDDHVGLRGGLLEGPRPLYRRISYLVQMLKCMSIPGFDLSRRFNQLYGRRRSILTPILLHNPTLEDEKWKTFWIEWRGSVPHVAGTPSDIVTHAEVAGAIEKIRELDLADPKLSACLFGLYVVRKEMFRAVNGYIFEFLSKCDGSYPFLHGPTQYTPTSAESTGTDGVIENVVLRGGADERASTSEIMPINLDSTASGSDSRETFPPIGQELIYLSALKMAESFVTEEPHPDDKNAAWKDFWFVYWHSIPDASESGMLRSSEVDATIQELEKRDLVEPDLSACLVGLKLARKRTFWEVQDAMVDAILARKKVSDTRNSAGHRPVPTNGEASKGGVSVETSNSDDDAEKMGLRGGAPERHKISYFVQLKDRSVDEHDLSHPLRRLKREELRLLRRSIGQYKLTADHEQWTDPWKNWRQGISHATDNSTTHKEADAVIERLKEPDLTEPYLSACLFALYALEKWTFIAVNGCIFDLLSGRMRNVTPLSTGPLQRAPIGDEGDSYPSSGRSRRPSSYGRDPQSLAMATSNAPEDTDSRTSSVGRTCGSQQASQNYSIANSSMKSTGATRKKVRNNSMGAMARENRQGSSKKEREEDPEEIDRQYLGSQKKRKIPSESEAQDAPQAARDRASGDVDKDASVTQLEGKADDDDRYSCARQRASNSQDTRHSQFGDAASIEAAEKEKEAPVKIRTIGLLKILDDLSGVRGDLSAFGESLHLFATKFGLAANEVRTRLEQAGQKLLYVLLGLTRDAILAEAQEKLDEAVKPGKIDTAEKAEVCAKNVNFNRRLKLKFEEVRRRRRGLVGRDSGLHGGAGDSAVPAKENPPLGGRSIALLKTLNYLNGLHRDTRASCESLDAFIAKCGMLRTRVRANLDWANKEIFYMLLGLIREKLLTQACETTGRIFEVAKYGKTQAFEETEACAEILNLPRWVRIESEGISRRRYGEVSMESGLRGGAGVYDSGLDVPTAAAFHLRRRDDYTRSWQWLHEPMAIDRRPFNIRGPQKGTERYLGMVSELRGGDVPDSASMQRSAKAAEQHTADGSNGSMIENIACPYGCGSNFCSTLQMHHNSNNSTFKSNSLDQPNVGSRLRNEARRAQPLSYSPNAHQTYAIPPGGALLVDHTASQPRDPSMAWQSNVFSATNGAVGLIGQADMCYYPDPVNSRFCTNHHIIHGRLRRPPPSSYTAPYSLDETTLMAQARALTLGSPYALDETTVMAQARASTLGSRYALDQATLMAQARALTLGFVNNGVPNVAMLQHHAKVRASQAFGHNPQWTHEMQPSARSHLWAALGGAYFGRGLQQTLASSRVASWSQNVTKKVEDEWGEESFTSSIGVMRERTLAPDSEAGRWKLQLSHCNKPAAMPSNTRKRQRTPGAEEDEGHRANASAPNQDARKRTKRKTFAGKEQRQQPSTFVESPSLLGDQHDDWEMVDAPLVFDQIFKNERSLWEGRTDEQDWATGMSFSDGSGTIRGGCLEDDAHEAHDAHDSHDHGSSSLPLRTAQQSTRQFTSCIRQVESGHSRIPGPVSPPNPLGQIPSSAPHMAITELDGTNDENQNHFVGGEIAEAEDGTQLNTDGFNVSFEVPPLTPDYLSARRNVTWRAAALHQMDEVLSTRRGREFVGRSRNRQPPSVLGRRRRSTSSVSPLSRPAPATREDSFASVASAQVPRHTLNPPVRTFMPSQQLANPLRQPFNPLHHALLDHPFIRSANGAVQFQVPFNSPNPLRPPLQPRELSSPQVYPVLTPRASTPPPRQSIAWDEDIFRGFQSDMEDPIFGRRVRVSRGQERQTAVTPPPHRRIPRDDESDVRGSSSDLENPADFAREATGFRRRQEALRNSRTSRRNGVPMFTDLSRLPRPEMSGGLALIEDDIWERNQRLAREAEAAPLYLRSFVDALPTGTVGGVHGDRAAYIDSLRRSTAASGHGAGERGGVPEGVWYNVTFERRLDCKPAPKRRRLNTRSSNHRRVLDSENDFSGAESDEDEEYVVFAWDVQIPAGGMKDLLKSTGTEWGVKATRARDWALEEMAREPKGEYCTEAIGEWWEAVRGGASRDERCKVVGVRVLEP